MLRHNRIKSIRIIVRVMWLIVDNDTLDDDEEEPELFGAFVDAVCAGGITGGAASSIKANEDASVGSGVVDGSELGNNDAFPLILLLVGGIVVALLMVGAAVGPSVVVLLIAVILVVAGVLAGVVVGKPVGAALVTFSVGCVGTGTKGAKVSTALVACSVGCDVTGTGAHVAGAKVGMSVGAAVAACSVGCGITGALVGESVKS